MKKLLFTSLLGLFALTSMAQEIGGCTSYFGDNYSPEATYNDSTCVYDLQQLLLDGTSIGDLLFSGVLESELVGLFAAGGTIIYVDEDKGKALVGCGSPGDIWQEYSNPYRAEDLSGALQADELVAFQYGNQIFDGESNWDIIRRSYAAQYGWQTGTTSSPYQTAIASGRIWDHINFAGYNDWFVPNESELLLYLDLAYSIHQNEGSQTIDWPMDPFGNNFDSWRFPIYDFGDPNHRYVTSNILNAGAPSNYISGEYVYPTFRAYDYYGNSYNWTGYNYDPSFDYNYIRYSSAIPMRIESFNAVNTSISCKDWDYGETVNQAIDAGVTCSYPLFTCDSTTSHVWDELVIGIYPANTSVIEYGRADTRDILLSIPETHTIDGNEYQTIGFEVEEITNVPPGLALNLNEGDVIESSDVHCIQFSEYALQEGVFDLEVSGTLFMDVLGSTLTTDITLTHRIAVTENVNGVQGCIYPTADNYNPLVTEDDGTCLFGGVCPGDFDGDGLIGIMDILHLLGIYDTSCE